MAHISGHEINTAVFRAVVPATLVIPGTVNVVTRLLSPKRRQAEADLKRLDVMRRSMGRMAECHDGLSSSEPVVRQSFGRGIAAMRACHWEEAISHFKEAMTVTKGFHLVALLNLTGVCHYTLGRAGSALKDFEASARLAVPLHAMRGRAQALNNIGLIHRGNGELDRALEYLEESLTLARELADHWAVAIQLGNTGNVWHDKGDLDKALEYHEQALALSCDIGDRWGEASELGNIGSVYLDKGETDKALKYYEEALAAACSIGYRLGVATGLANIASIQRKKGKLDKALEYEAEALAIARRAGYRLGMAVDLGNIGLDLMSRRKHKEAVPRLAAALAILLSIGVADGPRQALTGLVRCEDKLGRNRVQRLLKELGLREGKIADLLDRIDLMRMKRPVPVDNRQLVFATVGRQPLISNS